MQRTLNYTGRTKIEKKHALFSFREHADGPPEFNVVFSLKADEFSENASLYVEAYYKETRQRFSFGTVGSISPPESRILDEIDLSGPTLFRVLIVDESGRHGMLLASGDQFRADTDDDGNENGSLISVRKSDLGQLTWRVNFEAGMAPELLINSKIPDAIERVRIDHMFQGLIFPSMLREILTYYAWNDEDAEDNEYSKRWMDFAAFFGEEKPATNDPIELMLWIDEIVAAFSDRFDLTDMLVNSGRGGDG